MAPTHILDFCCRFLQRYGDPYFRPRTFREFVGDIDNKLYINKIVRDDKVDFSSNASFQILLFCFSQVNYGGELRYLVIWDITLE